MKDELIKKHEQNMTNTDMMLIDTMLFDSIETDILRNDLIRNDTVKTERNYIYNCIIQGQIQFELLYL